MKKKEKTSLENEAPEIQIDLDEEYSISGVELKEFKEKMENLEVESKENLNKALRAQADLDNYRKRNASLRLDSLRDGAEKIVLEILPILDNFERALILAKENNEDQSFIEGFEMIYKQMLAILQNNNVVEIDCLGMPFDPNKQMAIAQEENDEHQSGSICDVLQKGYAFDNGKVIRHAMVKVVS